jgi:short-subunit dehydrogenase
MGEIIMSFDNKVVWITGASSGIGTGLAKVFASEGARLILSGRRQDALAEVAKECQALGAKGVISIAFDTTDFDDLPDIVKKAISHWGQVDVLVNNAGISQRSFVLDTEMETYRKIMEVDFFAPIALTKLVLPHMVERGEGLIIANSSIAGIAGAKLRSGYCAAKHAMHGFFDSLRAEYYHKGIRVTMVVPGFVNTNVTLNALQGDGSLNAKKEAGISNAISVDEAGRQIMAGLKKGKNDIYVGSGKPMLVPWVKRLSPNLLYKMMRDF